ncbi:MAG: UbiD family decarboxylase [Alphaproteobacteria bacterium]|nr:UbiD family decarboxylase [Alphaproteobacteria bacterium]
MIMENYDGLRSFIESCREIGECVDIDDAHWDLEIGTLTEAAAEKITDPPMLLFDNIKGYPKGRRVVSLPIASPNRFALVLGLPLDRPKLELVRLSARKIGEGTPIPPREVASGPVMENVIEGDDVDVLAFPALRSHAWDGGRYIGTGDSLINRDPESGYINVGTYRMQVHEPGLLGLWMSPGQQGRRICERYWAKGEACPVVATFGGDPLMFLASHIKVPWGTSEFDVAGGMRGAPMEVIKGPLTGLPIPARAEIAIEGEVPPPGEQSHAEGPFGEWPGYYSGGTIGTGEDQPVIRVKAIYHRDDPILMNMAPLWPGAPQDGIQFRSGVIWDQIEAAGIPDVTGVYAYHAYMVVVAIRQSYAGHARQAGMAVVSCAAAARNGRYVVVVDDDIDPTDMKEVNWAMQTRVDPASDIQILDGWWGTPLDPRMPPGKRDSADYTNSRAIIYAVRPYTWRDKFPRVNRADPEHLKEVMEKYRGVLDFPK